MKLRLLILIVVCLTLTPLSNSFADLKVTDSPASGNNSLKHEVQHAIDKGLAWLVENQQPAGYWSQPEHPALTGLVLTGFMGEPSGRIKANPPEYVRRGYRFLLVNVKPDGGIYFRDMANYNTSVSIMALVVANNPEYKSIIRKARNFTVALQSDFDKPGVTDSPYDGGIGYGGRYQHSDLSNTMYALEALYYTKNFTHDVSADEVQLSKLNWDAARKFIERCQNLPSVNDQSWASDDVQNKGGFIYFPGNSKAGEMKLDSGKTALRSYGSISYAGLLSYIYADLDKDDPRVKAAFVWLEKNYTLAENPGMGAQGLYYYYHTMAKTLASLRVEELKLNNGKVVDWRHDLAAKMINLQDSTGMWVNENGRWWERDPVLVTAYAVITLEIIHRGL